MQRIERKASFGGWQETWTHRSTTLDCDMRFGIYLPPAASRGPDGRCPVVFWLSGLTCTESNFVTKAGAQRVAAELGLIIVAPDTSPRGADVPDDDAWDLGQGAGFYINATREPWAAHYRMYDYILRELPAGVDIVAPTNGKRAICGHSMGGHGALISALKNPRAWSSVSAIAPIVAPSEVPWGHKAFGAYLGDDRSDWLKWDACALIRSLGPDAQRLPLFVDQGEADGFLTEQLRPELLEAACAETDHPLTLRRHAGYDHSYFFIATVIEDHLRYHAKALR